MENRKSREIGKNWRAFFPKQHESAHDILIKINIISQSLVPLATKKV